MPGCFHSFLGGCSECFALLYFLPGYPFSCCLGSFVSNKILLQGSSSSSSYGCWAYFVFALEHAGFFCKSLHIVKVKLWWQNNSMKNVFKITQTHTHTHTHTHKERVRKNGVSPELWCQSPQFGGSTMLFRRQKKWLHQFSPIPWAVTTLFEVRQPMGMTNTTVTPIWVLSPFPSEVLSVHDSGGFFKV
jgi:hypothetical protein